MCSIRIARKEVAGNNISGLGIDKEELKKVINFIYRIKGIDLSSYRQNFVLRRLFLRMSINKCANHLDYINILKNDPEELESFFDALSINVSDFFRDPEVFAGFKQIVLEELLRRKQNNAGERFIRIWSAACATGQETYSIAILIDAELKKKRDLTVKIYGTDVDADALEKAEKGEYHTSQLKNIDKEVLEKYFIADYNDVCCAKPFLRQMVNFKRHNLIEDPPLKGMDVVFCRNVLIYFTRKQQDMLFIKFHQALNTGGYLIIGQVENVWARELFKAVDLRRKIYQKQ